MRLVIQRVEKASVTIQKSGKEVGKISKGLFVLVGVGEADTEKVAEELAEKLVKLRIMADIEGKMNLAVKETDSQILVVSQFTLFADTTGGNRPSFIKAAKPETAERIYNHFVERLKEFGVKTETGSFGEYMKIDALLDGPVTILFS